MAASSNLFRKYAVVLMVLVGGSLVAGASVELALIYREAIRTTTHEQGLEVSAAAQRIDQYLSGVASQLDEVSGLPWWSTLLDSTDRRDEFHRLMKLTPAISELRSVDAQGRERIRVSRTEADRLASGQPAGLDAQRAAATEKGTAFGATYLRDGSEPYITLAVRDRKPGTSVTLAEINLKFVGDLVGSLRVGREGKVYVVDGGNLVVAHPNLSLVLRRTNLSGYGPVRQIRASADAAARSLGMYEATGLEGGLVMVSAARIPKTEWLVVVEQPRSEVLEPVYAALLRTSVVFFAGLLAALVAAYVLARRLARPILEVRQGAGKIARGDLATRIDVKTGDEVEALADEFNFMADQLQDYTTGLERKVAEKTSELQLANRHKSEFLANMSHELRTPLNAVIGFSDALGEEMFGKLNPKQAEYVRDIHASGQHLLSLINDILDLSKIEAGRMELDLAEFNVAAALDNCRTLIRERAHSRGLKLAFDLPPDLGTWVADERKVKQVVLNLLSNAVKFTPQGGEVVLAARREADALTVSVRDSGLGIASGDQGTIFQEFRQLSTAGDAKNEGTGLGLSLSKRLVELHGGTIAVDSAVGRGATFTVRFPAMHPEVKSA